MLLMFLCLSFYALRTVNSIALDWVLTKELVSHVETSSSNHMILINSTWPPPTTIVNVGDSITISVQNQLDEAVTLHAHGFHQTNNNLYDGPEGITQCGVAPGGAFTYFWTAEEAGTFWVHSHHPGQYPEGLRAPFIVKDDSEADSDAWDYDADKDIVVDVSDTYYTTDQSQVDDLYWSGHCGTGLEVPPSGVAMNDQSNPIINTGSVSGGRIRLRFINMSAFSSMVIFLSGGTYMRVMEVDSVLIDRNRMPLAQSIELGAGQRTSVIVDVADLYSRDFNIYATIDSRHYAGNRCAATNTYAFTTIGTVHFSDSTATPWTPLQFDTPKAFTGSNYDTTKLWVGTDSKLANLPSWANKVSSPNTVMSDDWYYSLLPPSEQIAAIRYQNASAEVLGTTFLSLNLNAPNDWALFNGVNFSSGNYVGYGSGSPVLLEAMRPKPTTCSPGHIPTPTMTAALGQESYYSNAGVTINNAITLQEGQTVIMMLTASIGSHTFHMHGHDFQILYLEDENATPVTTLPWKILSNDYTQPAFPLRRDTLFIYSHTVAIIAWTANNPGAWFFHCHNDFHAMSGMAGVFVTGDLTGDYAAAWGNTAYTQCGQPAWGGIGDPWGFPVWTRNCLP